MNIKLEISLYAKAITTFTCILAWEVGMDGVGFSECRTGTRPRWSCCLVQVINGHFLSFTKAMRRLYYYYTLTRRKNESRRFMQSD